jgi:hypothetical protein
MIKKAILLTATTMALLAVPAVASAAEWTMGGKAITATSEIKLTGTMAFVASSYGGIDCPTAHVTLSADPGNMDQVNEFTGTGCETFGLLNTLFGCHVENEGMPTAARLPWTVTTIARGIARITGIEYINDMNAGCALGEEIVVADGTNPLEITANNAGAISSVSLSGELETNVGPSSPTGTLVVESPDIGTYGIE